METLIKYGSVFLITILITSFIVGLATIPLKIAMIVIGVKYKDECPVEDMIPIYVIVAGAGGLFTNCCCCCIGMGYNRGMRNSSGRDNEDRDKNPIERIVQTLLFAWFVCGNVWIYTNYEPNYTDPGSENYCNKTLYLFAFWVTNTYYIIYGLVMVCVCLGGTLAAAMFARFSAQPQTSNHLDHAQSLTEGLFSRRDRRT
ncbi:transmembrane protein 272-like [Oculina patagonica]